MAAKFAPKPKAENNEAFRLQQKFNSVRQEMNTKLVEREEEIDLALTALIAKEHVLLIGAPGTAKSVIAESLRKWISGGKTQTIHCCKDTSRDVAFGPLKLTALKQDRTERNLEGGAADVHVLVLEEVFKSGPAVLDMFLMLMNERVYREGLVQANSPLQLLMGVSNEWSPEGCEAALSAFFDRFLFRKSVRKISSRKGRDKLLWTRNHTPCFDNTITPQEIDLANKLAGSIPWSPAAKSALEEILDELEKEGICPGDRRQYKAVDAAQAYAFLSKDTEVLREHLEILQHVLWDDPTEQPTKCAKIVGKIANPVGTIINEQIIQIGDVVAKNTPLDAVPKLKAIGKILSQQPEHPRKEFAVLYLEDEVKRLYKLITEA